MSFPRYPSYRESGIDWFDTIPAHWGLERLRHVVTLNPSKSEVASLPDDREVTFLPMEAIGETGEVDVTRTRPLAELKNGYTYFSDGDLVFAKVTPCFENGKGALIDGLLGGCGFGTTELTVLRPHAAADAQFLRWLIFSDLFRGPGSGEMLGAGGLKRVPDGFVADFPVPWPSASERQIISAFLDRETAKIDALVEEQRRLVELLKEKRQAVISHAVTNGLDPTVPMKDTGVGWLGNVPAHWKVLNLSRVVDERRPITYGIVQPGPLDASGRYMIRGQDYSRGWADPDTIFRVSPAVEEPYRRARLAAGDVVVTIVGAGTGNSAVVPMTFAGANITQTTARVAPDPGKAESGYLALLFESRIGQIQIALYQKGAAQPGLNLEHLKAFRFPMPPLEEQVSIRDFVMEQLFAFSSLLSEAEAAVALLIERRAALISAAVTGKIDVRGAVPQQAQAA